MHACEERGRTLRASQLSMRPYSSQCSLSSAHAYPSRRDLGCHAVSAHTWRAVELGHIAPVHPHLQGRLKRGSSGRNDALRADAHRDVVEQGLSELLLHLVTNESQEHPRNVRTLRQPLTSFTSDSIRLVLSSRTPQLMSKPTPPVRDGGDMSVFGRWSTLKKELVRMI